MLEEEGDSFEKDLVSSSHGVQKVLDTVGGDKRSEGLRLMKSALGKDIMKLDHPSREAAQDVLSRIKSNFNFFHGDKCLVESHKGKECGDAVSRLGASGCQGDEVNHMCSYAEMYHCPKCGASFRFPRYRDAAKLLQTKVGRCGEFSDVALTVFDMLGYDSRLVVDHTDHVWVELNLPGKDGGAPSYVHADPSEGVLDNPLLYQDNWKKSLTFVFAHTPDKVTDRDDVYWHGHDNIVKLRGMSDAKLEKEVFAANMDLQRGRHLEEEDDEDEDDDEDEGLKSAMEHIRGSGDPLAILAGELEVASAVLQARLGPIE